MLNQYSIEDQKLMREACRLHSETEFLHIMIYSFAGEEDIQRGMDEALANGNEREREYDEDKRLVRRRIKKLEIKGYN